MDLYETGVLYHGCIRSLGHMIELLCRVQNSTDQLYFELWYTVRITSSRFASRSRSVRGPRYRSRPAVRLLIRLLEAVNVQ